MANLGGTVQVSRERLEAKLKRGSRFYVQRQAEAGGREMVTEAKRLMASKFKTTGAARALSSDVRMVNDVRAEISFVFASDSSKRDEDVLVFMNYGTKVHDVIPKNGGLMRWPAGSSLRGPWGSGQALTIADHPGQPGEFFLEEAVRVVQRRLESTGNAVRNR